MKEKLIATENAQRRQWWRELTLQQPKTTTTKKTKTKIELKILAAVHTLCIYRDNDHESDCDKCLI